MANLEADLRVDLRSGMGLGGLSGGSGSKYGSKWVDYGSKVGSGGQIWCPKSQNMRENQLESSKNVYFTWYGLSGSKMLEKVDFSGKSGRGPKNGFFGRVKKVDFFGEPAVGAGNRRTGPFGKMPIFTKNTFWTKIPRP